MVIMPLTSFLVFLWIGAPVHCWIKTVIGNILILLLILKGKFLGFSLLWMFCWEFYRYISRDLSNYLLFLVFYEFFFCYEWVSFIKIFFCIYWVNLMYFSLFNLLMWWMTFINIQILNYHYIPGITQLGYGVYFLTYCWFVLLIFYDFTFVFMSEIDLNFLFLCYYMVSISRLYEPYKMSTGVLFLVQLSGRFLYEIRMIYSWKCDIF